MEISIDSIEEYFNVKTKVAEVNGSRPAYNRKQVKCNGVTYASLKEACIALGLTTSKACVAINKGKSIKGFHLVYA